MKKAPDFTRGFLIFAICQHHQLWIFNVAAVSAPVIRFMPIIWWRNFVPCLHLPQPVVPVCSDNDIIRSARLPIAAGTATIVAYKLILDRPSFIRSRCRSHCMMIHPVAAVIIFGRCCCKSALVRVSRTRIRHRRLSIRSASASRGGSGSGV